MNRLVAVVLALAPLCAAAQTLELPAAAQLQSEQIIPNAGYGVPVGSWSFSGLPVIEVEGTLSRQVWRIDTPGLTTLQIIAPMREALQQAGFVVLYDCRTDACGGFDFRFGTEVAPPPEMQVDLGDFRYFGARRGNGDDADYVTLFVSRTSRAGFVQIISMTQDATPAAVVTVAAPDPSAAPEAAPPDPAPTTQTGAATGLEMGQTLETAGRVVLLDLRFESGSSQLGEGSYDSLRRLSEYLRANPARRVALVGHTDSAGSLDANIALSKRRATAVLERLVSAYGTDPAQVAAEGMGYLSPVASNLTPEGRESNRRVEVILTSTE